MFNLEYKGRLKHMTMTSKAREEYQFVISKKIASALQSLTPLFDSSLWKDYFSALEILRIVFAMQKRLIFLLKRQITYVSAWKDFWRIGGKVLPHQKTTSIQFEKHVFHLPGYSLNWQNHCKISRQMDIECTGWKRNKDTNEFEVVEDTNDKVTITQNLMVLLRDIINWKTE